MDPHSQINADKSLEKKHDGPAEFPVLIIGGGPVGLSTSLLLSYHGIRSLLVEQHPGTSIFPKTRMINARTMEIFRQLGIEPAVREIAIPHTRYMIYAPSLAGEVIRVRPIETVLPEPVRDWSPTWGGTITQDILEPVLLDQARRQKSAQIRFNMQLTTLEQHDEYVLATLVHRPSGRVKQVRARYLVGADGSHSTVRQALGIPMLGKPVLMYYVNILFHADLSPWTRDREINMALITNPEVAGLLLYNGGDRWRFTAFYFPERDQHPEDFTPERCVQLIRSAVGAADLTISLDDITPWNDAALVAEHFYNQRVFLAGDATHQMSPMGGFGMNVGIQDAHNLAWKLAAVLKGWGEPKLLDSYETERLPVSRVMVEEMARNVTTIHTPVPGTDQTSTTVHPAQASSDRSVFRQENGLVFGIVYDSAGIVPDGTAPVQVADPVSEYSPNARPGGRAPHVWIERLGKRISTLDLFGHEFILLAGSRGSTWCKAAKAVAHSASAPIQAFQVGPTSELVDPDRTWAKAYGVEEDGAVLVRPDGYVAWRSATAKAEPMAELELVLRTALAKQSIRKFEVA